MKFIHKRTYPAGLIFGMRLRGYDVGVWLGYGLPILWKPRLIGRRKADFGFGVGWLLLCLQVQVFDPRRDE